MSNNNTQKAKETYEATFVSHEEFVKELKEMVQNTEWLTAVPINTMEINPIFGQCGVFPPEGKHAKVVDTSILNENEATFTLNCGGKTAICMRSARDGLHNIAGVNGKVFTELEKNKKLEVYANMLNTSMGVWTDSKEVIPMKRYGVWYAMPSTVFDKMGDMSALEAATKAELEKKFGIAKFIWGYNSNEYTIAMYEFPSAENALQKAYDKATANATSKASVRFGAKFSSSDTTDSSATLQPILLMGSVYTPFGEPVKVPHRKVEGGAFAAYVEEIQNIYAKFCDMIKEVERLSNISIANPANCVVSICKDKAIAIPKKYGDSVRETVDGWLGDVSAYDVYLAFADIINNAPNVQLKELFSEKVARIVHTDWSKHDVGGIVAWGD